MHRVDQRTDIYSLGATLWHLITRQPPSQLEEPAVEAAIATIQPSLRPLLEICGRSEWMIPAPAVAGIRQVSSVRARGSITTT